MLNSDYKTNAPKFWPWGVFLFAILVSADLILKHFAKNIFRNYVFAFSVPLPIWLIYTIYFIVIIGIIYYLSKQYKILPITAKIAWAFILTGAVLNVFERIVLGYVRDFIYISLYHWTGIYNLADFYILFGIVILLAANKKVQN